MKTLTIFTPTYNRLHTLTRTYESLCRQTCGDFDWLLIDDGSTDGTREWVESLGERLEVRGEKLEFDWMGRVLNEDENENNNHFNIIVDKPLTFNPSPLTITYIWKPNGGLYTGYNVAYQTIQTELCVCIDSDDFMPDDAVEKIVGKWSGLSEAEKKRYCGIVGLDFDVKTKEPIGGWFKEGLNEVYIADLRQKKLHKGDIKMVMRNNLMKKVAPMIGFEGEKNFNPIYMLMQVFDKYPMLVENSNLSWVEYQIGTDSMSQGIYRQYINSPRSFAKMRIMEMSLERATLLDKFRSAIHYVSSCIIAKDKELIRNVPHKVIIMCAIPFGCMLTYWVAKKAK